MGWFRDAMNRVSLAYEDFTPREWWKESRREVRQESERERKHSEDEIIRTLKESGGKIPFHDMPAFYERLDQLVSLNQTVCIVFGDDRPDKDSKLWPRLRKCSNWGEIEAEFRKVQSGAPSPLTAVLSSSMLSGLTGGEIILAAFIASLVASFFFYAIYKTYKVKARYNPETQEVEIEFEPGEQRNALQGNEAGTVK